MTRGLLVVLLAMSSCVLQAQAFDEAALLDMTSHDRAVAERAIGCVHFSGEISGRGDQRDQWLAEQLVRLRCETVVAELRQIKPRYSAPDVLALLGELTDILAD